VRGAVIFDIDGTLIDSVDLHAAAWREALRKFGHEVSFERVRSQIGKGGDKLLPVFLTQAEIEQYGTALEDYRAELFRREYLPKAKPFPGVRPLFERLRRDGWKIALGSSAKKEEVEYYKKLADIDGLTDAEVTKSDVKESKPAKDIFVAALKKLGPLDPDLVLVVGDTPYDAEAAGKAGLRTIGVRCGGWADEALREAGCFVLYDGPADILARYDETPFGPGARVSARETPWRGKQNRVEIYTLRHALLTGGWSAEKTREIVERGHAVAVLPYDPGRDRVVLVQQFRTGAYAAGRFPWPEEVVAGMIDAGETPEQAASRECREEIGRAPDELRAVLTFQSAAAVLTQTVRLFCGRVDSAGLAATGGAAGEGEDIAILALPWDRVAERLAAGGYGSATTLIALQWLALNRDRLRGEWG
jgi:nudix-type nucleoside diphosphatase (YffH/AdpP family)/HAD superfamily hydrolase (TIGR01509 family)